MDTHSLESGALMIVRRTLLGAWKWAFLPFLRLECKAEFIFVMVGDVSVETGGSSSSWAWDLQL
jgi:hypothetical protein